MKKMIIFAVAFVATFAVSMKMYSSGKSVKPGNYYCFYNEDKGICGKDFNGSACYLVNEDCSWMN